MLVYKTNSSVRCICTSRSSLLLHNRATCDYNGAGSKQTFCSGGIGMTKKSLIVILILGIGLAAVHARAQQASNAAPKTISESKAVLDSWNDVGRKLIAMAEDFPEDKYDF